MRLTLRKKESDPVDARDLADRLEEISRTTDFFQWSIRALLQFLSDFALDIKEIKSDEFKDDINRLSEAFSGEVKLRKLQSRFEKNKTFIAEFIKLQKKYLNVREGELKDIIEILTNAMVTLDSENERYNQKILQQSEKIEQITFLDDIKKIKQILIQEIEQMRETVKEKQSRDSVRLDSLSRQVNTLNSQLEKARVESATDGLTGIYNRKAFDKRIRELVDENKASRASFSLLIMDIDDFKKINDNYGHQTGDRVILAVVSKCRQSIRGEDFLARYGGEEFVIILPGASMKNAVKKANHICKAIAGTRYCLDDIQGSPTLSVTISIGVSSLQEGDTVAAITDRADRALYAAKHAGKNRVVSEKDIDGI